jgi:hypothetical protein
MVAYRSLKEDRIVARGIALGAISETRLSAELREKLKPWVENVNRE